MPEDEKREINSIDENFKRGKGSYASENNSPISEEGVDTKDPANESKKLDNLAKEKNDSGGWTDNVSKPSATISSKRNKLLKGLGNMSGKKKSAALGIGGVVGVIAMLGTFLAPVSLFTAFNRNISITNDTTSTSMQRIVTKVLGRASANSAPLSEGGMVCTSAKSARCVGGKLTNKALNSLSKKGINIVFEDGTTYDPKNKRGMPKSAIKVYEIDGKSVKPKDLEGFLKKNPKGASKFLGVKGAWNMRFKSFVGKYTYQKFFEKLSLSRSASLAKALSKPFKNSAAKAEGIKSAIKARTPALQSASAITDKFTKMLDSKLEKAKANAIYLSAVVGCVATKIPSAIATAAAGAELLRLLPLIQDVMSAGDLATASGMYNSEGEEDIKFTPEAADALGTYLTAKDENGKSAMDSKVLQSALGVNTAPTGVSKKFAPGYSVINSPAISTGAKIEKTVDGACSYILSPVAMWTATLVGIAINGSILGGVINLAGGWVISKAGENIISSLAGWGVNKTLDSLLEEDKLEGLEGEELGDALGTAAKAYFSSHGTSRNMPVMSQASAKEAQAVQQAALDYERDLDIASHSPFDASNHNTFMGRLVNNAQLAMIKNGGLSTNLLTRLGAFAKIPVTFASYAKMNVGASANAASLDCGYAKDFNLEVRDSSGNIDEEKTPAINAAGTPCTGLTQQQSSMSLNDATEALVERGWVKGLGSSQEDVEVDEDVGVEDYLRAVIVKDSLVETVYDSCSNLSDGTYLTEVSGCIAQSSVNISGVEDTDGLGSQIVYEEGENSDDVDVSVSSASDSDTGILIAPGDKKYTDAQALNAIPVFLMSVMAERMINGADDEEPGTGIGGGPVVSGEWTSPACGAVTSPFGMRFHPIYKVNRMHNGIDIADGSSPPVVAAKGGKVSYAGFVEGYGNFVAIDHETENMQTGYAHLAPNSLTVKVGDTVSAGQQIGVMGTTGDSTGVHLHFEIRSQINSSPTSSEGVVDPVKTLKDAGVSVGQGC